ncbi:MAG: hypothetical protein JST84_00825 [Acidobacteria bacterium]|nr:hypothetical protein [Acidobacteriota bacterium]
MFRRSSLLVLTALVGAGLAFQAVRYTTSPNGVTVPVSAPANGAASVPQASPASTTPQTMKIVPSSPVAKAVQLPRAKKTQLAKTLPKSTVEAPDVLALNTGISDPTQRRNERGEREEKKEGGKRYDQPDEAAKYYSRKREPVKGKGIPTERYAVARNRVKQMRTYSSRLETFIAPSAGKAAPELLAGGAWTPLGPGNIGGRTRAILINPANPNMVYAAGVAGGIWRSSDGGLNWTAMADIMANLAVCTMVLDPTNPDIIYAGTGEGFGNGDAVRGAGIFKTTNGGITWDQLPGTNTPDFYYVNKLVMSAKDNKRLYAATRTGIWRTVDSGATWTKTYNTSVNLGVLDLAIRTDKAADVVFATTGYDFDGLGDFAKIIRNNNAATTDVWNEVYAENGVGRIALSIAPSDQNVIYASAATTRGALFALLRSSSSGDADSWNKRVRGDDPNALFLNRLLFASAFFASTVNCGLSLSADTYSQGWYDNVIAVDPLDANRVWVGGIDLFRSDDGGANWGLASYYYKYQTAPQSIHVDQHAIVFHPNYNGTTNQTMFVGNDGGLYRTDNARAKVATGNNAACNVNNSDVTWLRVNNSYGVTQFYHGAVYPDGKTYFGGTQDNGTIRGTDGGGINNWREINGGDGGYVAVNPFNTNTLFAEYTNISLRKSTNGGLSFHPATTGIFAYSLFITPFAMDPSDPNRLWIGGDSLYRTTNAATYWTEASDYLFSGGIVSAIAIAPTDANWVLAGDEFGYIYGTDRALSTTFLDQWDSIKPRDGFVSGITIDPKDKNIAYATYSTFGDPHVWRTINAGQTWESIDGTGTNALPDIPVHCLVVDPSNTQRLYIGTDIGVFASLDGGANWSVENTGFPNVVVESLVLNIQNGVTTLYAFTHGRGAWKVDINNTGCNYSLSSTGQSIGQAGGTGSVGVTASAGSCSWIAKSNEDWITVNSFSATTTGNVSFTVAANNAFWPRLGTIEIAGRSYTIAQGGKTDTIAPTVKVTSPTTQPFATTINTLTIGAEIQDNDAINTVRWQNNRGNSGIFIPSGSGDEWNSSLVNLRVGQNVIKITATDRAGNTATALLTVSLNAQADDATAPTVKITLPTTNPTYITSNGLITLEGSAADNRQITHLLWSNDRGGSGRTFGTTAWDIEDIPLQVGVNKITVTAYDINSNTAQATLTVLSNPQQSTRRVAGTSPRSFGYNGDNRQAITAQLWGPNGLAFDASGNLYIADTNNHRIRKVTPAGIITTVAGNGLSGLNGDGGPAIQASLHSPVAVVFDAAGNLFIADADNHKIRKVTPDGMISTFAGTGEDGFSGDGGKAPAAFLSSPAGLAVDAIGNVFIADSGNNCIRKVNVSDGTIITVAGNGSPGFSGDGGAATAAQLNYPLGIAVDRNGNLFISDVNNLVIRKVGTDGKISRFAGTGNFGYSGDGGLATQADMSYPVQLAVDKDGNVAFVDNYNAVIRRVTTDGKIATVFGNEFGAIQEGIAPNGFGFIDPRGVAIDAAGNFFVSDLGAQHVVATNSLNSVATVESAGYSGPMIARDALVSAFGVKLATAEAFAPSNPAQLPTTLAGTTVTIRDSKGVDRAALLLYVGPNQVNYILPENMAEGFALVTIRNSLGETSTGFIEVVSVKPGLFTANSDGTGAAVGWAIRVRNGVQLARENIIALNPTTNKYVTKSIDFDPATEELYLELYGTGIRYRSSLANVSVEIGGVKVPVEYAFVAPGFYGLDQVNIKVPASLDNRGEMDLVLTVDGQKSKTLKINIK